MLSPAMRCNVNVWPMTRNAGYGIANGANFAETTKTRAVSHKGTLYNIFVGKWKTKASVAMLVEVYSFFKKKPSFDQSFCTVQNIGIWDGLDFEHYLTVRDRWRFWICICWPILVNVIASHWQRTMATTVLYLTSENKSPCENAFRPIHSQRHAACRWSV